MNYWITSHFPQHEADFTGPYYAGVWLQEGREHIGKDLRPGDLVFKYESRTGRARTVTTADGKQTIQKCLPGKMGIVAIMKITKPLEKQTTSKPENYTDGSSPWWRYYADAEIVDDNGFVSQADLNVMLGYSVNNRLRGFGDDHSGLKRIDKVTFDKIYAIFKQNK